MKNTIIFGNGEFASIAKYYFSDREIKFFCVDDKFYKDKTFENVPVIPQSELLKMDKSSIELFVSLSYKKMNTIRANKYLELKQLGFEFTSFIHKESYISNKSNIGENCFILENQNIQRNVKIKNNVFMWSGNHIGHNSIIKDHTYLSSHVVISGNCEIGEKCFFGVNSAVKDATTIGDECMIGMGANVIKNLKKGSVVISEKSQIYDSGEKISKLIKYKV